VSEDIRIIEIDGFDYTPCGGTHCTATGQIGVIKIVKTEKQNERIRVHFAAGWLALELFQASYNTISEMATSLSVGQNELPATLARLSDQVQKLQKDLQGYQIERLAWEAERLVQAAQVLKKQQVVIVVFPGRPVSELRLLGSELAKHNGVVSLLACVDGEKLTILTTCGEGTGLAARDLLGKVLTPFQGRGGGDARLAQGGGTIGLVENLEQTLNDILSDIL
jgi:alanyl-tRNA synthetase